MFMYAQSNFQSRPFAIFAKSEKAVKTYGSPCQLDTLVPNVVTRNFILNIVPLRSGAYGEDDNLALALLVRVRR